MRKTIISSLALAAIACLGFGTNTAQAQNVVGNYEAPGSLLVYPLYDNTRGALTFMTVTNTSPTTAIFAHFIYINSANCLEADRPHYLSPLDTITVQSRLDNPNNTKGYLYVFAKNVVSPTLEGPNAVKFDHLIGQEWVFDVALGDLLELNAFTFKAGDAVTAELGNTDVSPANGKRDLNGHEYNFVPDVLEFPRFFGQVPGQRQSELVLINLTGGGQFEAHVDILAYGNNEDQFSAAVDFTCWTRRPLSSTNHPYGINAMFDNQFLYNTASLPEVQQTGVVCGWFTVDGTSANSTQTQLNNPAILGVLLDSFGSTAYRTTALPYGEGTNTNGRLLSHSLMGD
jgi:hypothetical protein